MATQQMKIRNRNLFLPLNNQVAEFMKMHDQKIKEYQDYLNYLHFNIIQNARNEQNKKEFKVPPPTPAMVPFQQFTFPPPSVPVSLELSNLATPPPLTPISQAFTPPISPSMEQRNKSEQQTSLGNLKAQEKNIYSGKEVNVWGPGLLGLFAKTPSQLNTKIDMSQDDVSLECDLKPQRMRKPHSIKISDQRASKFSYISSPKSSIPPPGFEHSCSTDVLLRDEMFNGNRSM